ncbi:hypothetical protein IEU95_05855 [Hoyosella rhizosphaerae]|uniref:ABC transporter permease n=1 Tax=Hoyosella rhizosphaerae TaxID=1755582 RepID=A0A916U5E8_9ACTN|nr:hypothetical protein [Hoyosella rhizosphaerae]MBN4926346.1 hypothetical protein [Hoyosella rhizosphaerae]GGC60080.1 hypothetical protein GCM10011410_10680 [Hoyosella rhizosphaerae]
MIKTTWRQYRTLVVLTGVAFAALAVGALASNQVLRSYSADTPGPTPMPRYDVDRCTEIACIAGSYMGITSALLSGLVFLFGALVGATLTARPRDTETHILAFTQSSSRWSWMSSRVLVVVLPLSIAAGLLGAAYATTRTPEFAGVPGRFSYDIYVLWGPVTAAMMFASMMVGAVLGLFLKSTYAVPAALVAVILGGMIVGGFRSELTPPETRAEALHTLWTGTGIDDSPESFARYRDWEFRRAIEDFNGDPIGDQAVLCPRSYGSQSIEVDRQRFVTSSDELVSCLEENGAHQVTVYYHPDEHFWTVQFRESMLYLLAGLALLIPARLRISRL